MTKKPSYRFAGYTAPWVEKKLGEISESFEYGLNASAKEFDGVNKYIRITDIDDSSNEFLKTNLVIIDYLKEIYYLQELELAQEKHTTIKKLMVLYSLQDS